QEQLRNPDPSRKETTAHLTGSKNPASPKPGSNLRGKPGSALGGIQHVRDLLGDKGTVELTGLIGYYSLLAMQLNVFRVEPPEGTAIPWW
ncbi:MAG: hypothetical protein ACK53H_07550, partial [Betaproteobacteria bacterium]